MSWSVRRPLPDERDSITHRFVIGGQKGYLTVGLYPDGTPGEIFIKISKLGSTVSGFADAFAKAVSRGLQRGDSLEELCETFSNMRFEPMGMTNNPDIPEAASLVDYIFRWLKQKFVGAKAAAAPLVETRRAS